MSTFTPQPYWLLHHGQLLEWTTEPVANRMGYIKNNKPKNEIAIRLEWLRPVKNPERLPKRLVEASAEYDKASDQFTECRASEIAKYDKAWTEVNKAHAEYVKAWDECMPEIIALHKEECPGCPFDYEKGELIFPHRDSQL